MLGPKVTNLPAPSGTALPDQRVGLDQTSSASAIQAGLGGGGTCAPFVSTRSSSIWTVGTRLACLSTNAPSAGEPLARSVPACRAVRVGDGAAAAPNDA